MDAFLKEPNHYGNDQPTIFLDGDRLHLLVRIEAATPLSIILEIPAKPMPTEFCRKILALFDGGDNFVFRGTPFDETCEGVWMETSFHGAL